MTHELTVTFPVAFSGQPGVKDGSRSRHVTIELASLTTKLNDLYLETTGNDIHIGMGIFHHDAMEMIEQSLRVCVKDRLTEPVYLDFKEQSETFISECMHKISVLLMDCKQQRYNALLKEAKEKFNNK